mmetsp:Transcript_2155/g.5425  ORF Transcript_2155/g.5425 Transcript_2155/m.5425 type:complete len:100 (+) Transcript_2155:3552-3851(+)
MRDKDSPGSDYQVSYESISYLVFLALPFFSAFFSTFFPLFSIALATRAITPKETRKNTGTYHDPRLNWSLLANFLIVLSAFSLTAVVLWPLPLKSFSMS